jgi:hypothetical protein
MDCKVCLGLCPRPGAVVCSLECGRLYRLRQLKKDPPRRPPKRKTLMRQRLHVEASEAEVACVLRMKSFG